MTHPLNVLLVASHPVQYATPVFRRYASDPALNVTVAYSSLRGAEPAIDRDFGVRVRWDVPLLDGYRWKHVPGVQGQRFGRLLRWWNPKLWRLVRDGRFDVVVCYGYRAAFFWIAAAASKMSGAKLLWVTDATSLLPRDESPWSLWKVPVKRLVVPLALSTGDGVLAPSSRTTAFLRRIGLRPARVHLVPFVVDNDFFERASTEAAVDVVRAEWGVPRDAFVALFAGKLVGWKRPEDLLQAASRVPRMYVVIAGDGPLRYHLEREAERLGIAGRVRFLGFVNQSGLPAIYHAADVLVLPSKFEPFGLVVNEAFASGTTAVVSSACGAVGDVVRDNETGFAYPAGDVRTLGARLGALAESPQLLDRLTQRARSRIREWGIEENTLAFVRAVRSTVGHAR